MPNVLKVEDWFLYFQGLNDMSAIYNDLHDNFKEKFLF